MAGLDGTAEADASRWAYRFEMNEMNAPNTVWLNLLWIFTR